MGSYALAAIGRDRPGIVAAVAKVLYEQGCNVEDASMTLLRGNFAIQLVLAAPEEVGREELEAALGAVATELGLQMSVRKVEDTADVPHPSHILTVYGADRPGILYRVTEALAAARINITDLNSRLVGATTPVYAVMLELAVPDGADTSTIASLAGELGVDVTLRVLEDDVL
jgi:glycine cleavage system transcriptional repressor